MKPRKLAAESLEERQLLAVGVLTSDAVADTANIVDLTSSEISIEAIKQAISEAAATPGDDVIQIAAGSLQFASANDEITIDVDPATRGAITIVALDDGLTIDANSLARAFSIKKGDVTLQNITVRNGSADYGGAIANAGDLTLVDVTLQSNIASVSGGAIANKGALVVEDSLITGNGAVDSGSAIYEGDFSWPVATPKWSTIADQVGSKGTTVSVDLNQYVNDGDWSYSYSIADSSSAILASTPTLSASGVLSFTFIGDSDYYAEDDYSAIAVTVSATNGKTSASTSFNVAMAEQTSVTLAAVLSNDTISEALDAYRQGTTRRPTGYAADAIPSPTVVDVTQETAVQIWLQDFDWTEYDQKVWDAGDFYVMGVQYRIHLENATVDEEALTAASDLSRSSYVFKKLDNGDYEFIVAYTSGANFGYEEALLLDVLPIQVTNSSKPVSATIYQINTDFTFPCYTRIYDSPTPRDPSRSHINVDPSQTLFISTISNSSEPLSAIPGNPFDTNVSRATLDDDASVTVSGAVSESTASMALYNVTIADNASWSENGAIYLQSGANADLYNTIVADNTGSVVVVASGAAINARNVLSSFVSWSNSDANSFVYDSSKALFTDAAGGDYTLANGSQAIDKGDVEYVRNDYDLAGRARVQNGIVDLGAYESAAPSKVDFDYSAETRKAVLTWTAIDSAATYTVRLSRDGGATWANYAKGLTATTATVSGLYAGKTYLFQIVGTDASGAALSTTYDATFAPIALSSTSSSYSAGDTITVSLSASSDASASVRWYFVTAEGDVEIAAAHGLYSYAPSKSTYDVKVVATGTGASEGSNSEITIATTAPKVSFDYNASTRKAVMSWNGIAGAASYTVKISKDGGATWANYVKGVTGQTTTISGLYTGKSYGFQIVGVDASGAALSTVREATLAPIAMTVSATSYGVGDTISVSLAASENASADIRWYYVTDAGDVEIAEAAGLTQYAPDGSYDVKVVATGTGDSLGSNAEATVATTAPQLSFDYDASTRKAALSWTGVYGAASYTVKISKDGGATWSNYVKGVTSKSTTVSGLYTGKSYSFQIYGVNASGATLSTVREGTLAPIAATVSAETYKAGDTLSVSVSGADNASYDVRWYSVTNSGDVEIASAAGRLEYTPTSALYDVKVVVTGTGDSAGSNVEATIATSSATIAFNYNSSKNQATLEWNAISGAVSYTVQISKDGGQTWTNSATGVTTTSKTVSGIYAGQSYDFRVVGIDASGSALTATRGATFAPIAISAASATFNVGDTVALTLTGAQNASAEIRWYEVGADGDVEIESARNSLSYKTTSAVELKVVATGLDDSLGSESTLNLTPASLGSVTLVRYTYTDDVHQALIKWPTYEGAVYYNLEYTQDGGQTWNLYAKNFKNYYKGVNGVYPGKTYSFRVTPLDSAKQPMTTLYYEGTFAPIILTSPAKNYTAGLPIELGKLATADATCTIKWYQVTPSGDVEIKAARNLTSYTPENADYDLKVVSTGTGLSLKSNYELTISADSAIDVSYDYDSATRKATVSWDAFDDAATYVIKISKDGGSTWTTYKSGLTTPEAVVSGLYSGRTYGFRIVGLSSSKTILSTYQSVLNTSTSSSAVVDDAFADFFEEGFFD